MRGPFRRAIETAPRGGYGSQAVGSFPLSAARELRAPQRIRVLVADDEPHLRGALAELLAQEEQVFFVGAAADADEAIALAEREQPDVALLDVKMPAGGGPRAAREIQRLSPSTRVIALSAFEDRPTVLEMLRAGCVGYLVKGTAAEEILGSIRRVAQGGTSLSDEVVGGIVHELSSQLRRQEIEEEQIEARRDEIHRFIAGEGLSMAYQPIVNLEDHDVIGVEALARFRSFPMRRPDEWFAEARGIDLGVDLELAAIRQATIGLPKLPPRSYLSVNCSHRAARSVDLAPILEPLADRMVVEITEHEAVDDYDELARWLAPLRGMGVRIAIDDAGAGYASLRHTLQIAPDIVKVDISLTRSIDEDRGKRAIAKALISFAQEMGMTIVAEGIETDAELRTLLELGVRYGQGYFLAQPGMLPDAR
jgi:EAL domain-containing protein (putative c-di-GMP-specific phosphodiesterase class I)/AmiR/NasT family two-component response regulator